MSKHQNNGWGGRRAGTGRKQAKTRRRCIRLHPQQISGAEQLKALHGIALETYRSRNGGILHPILKICLDRGLAEANNLSLDQIIRQGCFLATGARKQIQLSIDDQVSQKIDSLADLHNLTSYAIIPLLIQIGRNKLDPAQSAEEESPHD
jgi:hypothetical protein